MPTDFSKPQRETHSTAPGGQPATPSGTPLGATGVAGADLATNPPGAACVYKAKVLREATPIRSRAGRLLQLKNAESFLRATATGERKVAIALDRLGPQWRVLHAVPVGLDRPAISHLVIGPKGVFTLATRTFGSGRPHVLADRVEAQVLGDEIRIHGETMPYVAEARAQAWRTARVLSAAAGQRVFVRPAVVIVGVDDVRFYTAPERVEVLPRRHLLRWLGQFPVSQGAADVARIYAAARRGDTWVDPKGAPPGPGAPAH